jgi:hypothetical protein
MAAHHISHVIKMAAHHISHTVKMAAHRVAHILKLSTYICKCFFYDCSLRYLR